MQASEFIYENIGTKYEADINKSLYANDVGSGKGAGSGHGADAVMIINKKQYPVEIKAKNARDFGQGTLDYNGKKWVHVEDNVRMDITNTTSRATYRTKNFNTKTSITLADGTKIDSKQSLSNILSAREDK